MGSRNRDRELREMRTEYVAAARRLDVALRRFDASGTPMDPGPDVFRPHPWTAEQVRIVLETAAAFARVVDTRQTWDAHRRERRSPH